MGSVIADGAFWSVCLTSTDGSCVPLRLSRSENGDGFDLNEGALGKGRHLHAAARRIGLRAVFGHHFVDLGKVVDVGDEDADLDDVGDLGAGFGQHRLEVREGLFGLRGDALNKRARGRSSKGCCPP